MFKSYYLVSLGCAKNTVDSESMASLLSRQGLHAVENPSHADLLIVNTCGFIHDARQESISVLNDLSTHKKKKQYLIAAGCLTERSRQHLAEQIPGIDAIIGSRRWMDILQVVEKLKENTPSNLPLFHLPDVATVGSDEQGVARVAIQGGSAYLKIADGCRRPCAFCSIPLIKGTLVSRPMDHIIQDAQFLQKKNIQEINLIAQDTTDYGSDLGIKDGLSELLQKLCKSVPDIPWIRVLYAYPGYVTDTFIDVMAQHKQILPYLDMPLQHAHPDTLRRMRRPSDVDWIYRTLEKMRKAIPDLVLRTTFITGYPGETQAEFQTLLDFISEIKFDHIGAFTFSFEPGTTSEPLGDPVPFELKQERLEKLMQLQENISLTRSQSFIGKNVDTLIEGCDQGVSVGRSFRDAPEIDGFVIIEGKAPVGAIVPVKINSASPHDLFGVPV